MLPPDEQAPEVPEPREAPLHFVALAILVAPGEHRPPALGAPPRWAPLRGDAHPNVTASQGTPKRATIIPAVRHQLRGALSRTAAGPSDGDGVQGLLGQPHLRTISAVQVEPEREAVAIDDEHPLGPLTLLGEPDLVAALLGRHERAVEEGHGPV